MKRPYIFHSLLWIPLAFAILYFWSGHLTSSTVPLLERFSMISPGSLMIFVLLLVIAGGWTLYLWLAKEKERSLRPITLFGCWLLLVLCMGAISFGDIWQMGALPITEAQKTDLLLREFGRTDALAINSFVMFGNLLGVVLRGILAILFLVAAALGIGTWIRKMFPETLTYGEQLLLQLGAGFSGIILLMTVAGLFGILTYFGNVILLLAVLGVVREGRNILRALWRPMKLSWSKKDGYLQPFFVVGLMLVIAASFLHVLRPIPIGWDDIGVYMNVASLTAEHGTLVSGYGTYAWGLIMSLGFIGWKTPFVAMLFSFLGGLLSFFGLGVVLRHIRGKETTSSVPLFLVTAFAMAPFVLFQLGEDMKIDLALLFTGTVAMLISMLLWRHEYLRKPSWYLLLGIVLGIALGIKMTAILLIAMVLGLLLLRFVGGWGLTAMLSWFLIVLILGNVFAFAGLDITGLTRILLLSVLGILAVFSSVLTLLRTKTPGKLVQFVVVTIVGILLAFSPWMIFNIRSWCTTTCPPLSVTMLVTSASQSPVVPAAPVTTATGATMGGTGATLQQDLQQSGGTVTEELGRYAGFDQSPMHYLSLPFDSTFSKNVSGDYVTLGWVFMALVLLAGAWAVTQHTERSEPKLLMGLYTFLIVFLWAGSMWTGGSALPWILHILTIGVGLMLCLAIVYAAHHNHDAESFSEEIRHLLSRKKLTLLTQAPLTVHIALITVIYGFLWMYLASGVVWYGITGFIGILLLGTAVLEQMREKEETHASYLLFLVLVTVFWILPMYGYKLTTSETSIKRFDIQGSSVVSSFTPVMSYDTRQFSLFKAGVLDQESGLKLFNGEYYAASKFLNDHPSGKIYRVGTLLPYFIKSNDTRIATDNQLDQFIAHYLPEANPTAFAQRLYDAGFRYIIFDLGTASIDKTKEKTLTQKVSLFQQFTADNPALKEEITASGFIIWSIQPTK